MNNTLGKYQESNILSSKTKTYKSVSLCNNISRFAYLKPSRKKLYAILCFLFFLTFFLATVSAQEFYQQDKSLDIRHSVRIGGAPTSAASCNITVFSPNKTVLVSFQPMSFSSTAQTYNYTVPSANVSQFGEYCYDVTCVASPLNQTDSFCIQVNPIGANSSVQESLIYIAMMIFIGILFCVCFYYGFMIPFSNTRNEYQEIIDINWKKYLKMFCIGMAYLLLVVEIYFVWNLSFGYLYLRSLSEFFRTVYVILFSLSWGIIPLIVIICIVKLFSDRNVQNLINKGIPVS